MFITSLSRAEHGTSVSALRAQERRDSWRRSRMSQRIAYVTGGMGGIGTAICKRLSRDGFRVIAGCGPNSSRRERWLAEMRELGHEIIASEGNVADWDSTTAAFDQVKA